MSTLLLGELVGKTLAAAPNVSDILFAPDRPVQAEVYGKLVPILHDGFPEILAPFHTELLAEWLIGESPRHQSDLAVQGACDLAFELPGRARFRANVFRRRGSLTLVMRRLPTKIPSCADLGLPAPIREMAMAREGLVLVCGATGSGKTTTLAAMIDAINETRPVHVLTLEDPVEFVHRPKLATISQRELGVDFPSFAAGLRSALRQAPKVILVGEIRDRETVEAALRACETGHLVLGTIHAPDCGQSVNRVLGMFETADERLIRNRLASGLVGAVSQRLIPRIGGGRTAAFEIMVNALRVRECILNGETEDKTFYDIISSGAAFGMTSFDQSLGSLFESGQALEETVLAYASDRSALSRELAAARHAKGDGANKAPTLQLDLEYSPDGA